MTRCDATFCAAVLLVAMVPCVARAQAFSAHVDVVDGANKQSADSSATEKTKTTPAADRPHVEVGAGAKLTIHWAVTRTATDAAKDVLVHFYVVRIARPGQAPPALAPNDVLLESALTMDFDPKTTSSAEMSLRPEKPGVYLLRIEIGGATAAPAFAAIDLVVK